MTKFAFIIHPMTAVDMARRYPLAKYLPSRWVEAFGKTKKPLILSEITGIKSLTGAETEGWFLACPLTARQLVDPKLTELAQQRIFECTELAADLGAEIIGLGAFTAVSGDGGVSVAKKARIGVTSGNSYTIATAIEGALKAAALVNITPANSTLAVVGATGSIGKTCATLLAPEFSNTLLIGRDLSRTEAIAEQIAGSQATTDLSRLSEADVVITVTSSDTAIIEPKHLRSGCVVCDVARPRDVQAKVAKERNDVLVIEGGVVSVPGDVQFNFEFGFPPKTAYACMSETMMLALENRPESYTLGKDVSVAQVEETRGWAEKHGFKLAGFRSFEHALEQEAIDRVLHARQMAFGH